MFYTFYIFGYLSFLTTENHVQTCQFKTVNHVLEILPCSFMMKCYNVNDESENWALSFVHIGKYLSWILKFWL